MRKTKKQIQKEKSAIQIKTMLSTLLVLVSFMMTCEAVLTYKVLLKDLEYTTPTVTHNTIKVQQKKEITGKYDKQLEQLGNMGKEIHLAAEEFGGDKHSERLKGLLIGIAKAESSLGTKFYKTYDFNCHNYWGIRKVRNDGSYLRCFSDDKAGARTAASLLMRLYINMGLDTPEKIVKKWVGPINGTVIKAENHKWWLNNVNAYYKE